MSSTNVPTYGNYRGYYNKRPFLSDERLAVLPPSTFAGARVLDVGCNEGWVTCEIAQCHGADLVVGVDIDDALIQAAWKRKLSVWSTQGPSQVTSPVTPISPTSIPEHRKRKANPSTEDLESNYRDPLRNPPPPRNYFPLSCDHEFGTLPVPPSAHRGKTSFPHNVSFRTADWTKTEIPEDAAGYDVVVAFSVSKWIHLNEGDKGLRRFFRRVYEVLNPGGAFILEPQPWDSYSKAKRMNQTLKENAKSLVIRPTDFESILQEIGFGPASHYTVAVEGGFNRPIDLYNKITP
ncbi:hypothetical protein D9619_010718 [Psilocybe cf. subviscida]|uniref:RNA methyltransferase n=1 Tax=Psilocybe cf. subviscida TaxID=2480587 RepID=A0A8H5B8K4_9AGAR|nr:hypothetical protein D9619_010718 [Psilocybe cf. subviscida]